MARRDRSRSPTRAKAAQDVSALIDLSGLRIATAHVAYTGPGRLDLTPKSRSQVGVAFAPAWGIVEPWKDVFERALAHWSNAAENARIHAGLFAGEMGAVQARTIRAAAAEHIEETILRPAWEAFAVAYNAGIERSKAIRMDAWTELGNWARAGREVVGVCDCDGKQARERRRCHRFLWAEHLIGLGAMYGGEIVDARRVARRVG